MQKAKFTFQKMNQDISPSKHKPEIYYEGRNIRVVTNDQQSTGSLSTDLGNEVCVSIPNGIVRYETGGDLEIGEEGVFIPTNDKVVSTPPTTRTETVAYSNKELNSLPKKIVGLTIIGYANIREDLYVFTTNEDNEPTANSTGQIWKVNIENCTVNLVYYNYLGFSTKYPIRKAIGKYENEKIQKIYWTDFNNFLRSLNVTSDTCIDTPLTNLDNAPSVVLNQPILEDVKTGGSFSGGKVQYAYSLYDTNGPMTKPSPLSALYPVAEINRGINFDEESSSTFVMKIPSVDTRFKNIRIYRVHYTSVDQEPLISLIDEFALDGESSDIVFSDSGDREIENYSIEEFLFLGADPVICKDIETKDSHLFPANIVESFYDPDYDARAYRYDDGGTCVLNDRDNNQEASFTGNNFPTDKTLDAINPSNKAETNLNYSQSNNYYGGSENSLYNKYVYKSNGVALGGEGPNVSYNFITVAEYPKSNTEAKSGLVLNDNSKLNPKTSEFVGYKRDEVYRFAIVLFNEKWQSSFPLWVGDIRMPDTTLKPVGVPGTNDIQRLGVSFTVDNLPEDCVAYQIVRVERRDVDKTCVSQGMVNPMTYLDNSNNVSPEKYRDIRDEYKSNFIPSWITRTFHTQTNGTAGLPRPFVNALKIGDGANWTPSLEIRHEESSSQVSRVNSNMIQFYSPDVEHDATNFKTSQDDYFKVVFGTKESDGHARSWFSGNGEEKFKASSAYTNNIFQNIADHAHQGGVSGFLPSYNKDTWRRRWVITRMFQGAETISTPVIRPDYKFVYTERSHDGTGVYTRTPNQYIIPASTGALGYKFADTIYHNGTDVGGGSDNNHNELISNNGRCLTGVITEGVGQQTNWLGKGFEDHLYNGDYENPSTTETAFSFGNRGNNGTLCIVDYKRKVVKQYGGDSYESRQRNTYIPAGRLTKSESNFSIVWGGDTFIGYYYLTRTTVFKPEERDNKTSYRENLIFPLESSIPLDLRYDYQTEEVTRKDVLHEEVNKINRVYEQENVLQSYVAKPFNFETVRRYDNRIKGSKTKINGELIDSWLDYPVNDFIDLDGVHGGITALVENNDELFAFQPTGVAHVAVNPRVQIVGSDNASLELGTGGLLHDYKYLTTSSGTSLQFGVKRAGKAIYYVDDRNYKIYQLLSQEKPISDLEGMHRYLKNNVDWDRMRIDNPIKESGAVIGWNKELHDVFFTFVDRQYDYDDYVYERGSANKPIYTLLSDDSFTVAYNELMQGFTSFYDFHPTLYTDNRNRFFSVNNDSTLWRHNKGPVNSYYGTKYPSEITVIANPDPDYTKIFNTLHYESQVKVGNLDQPLNTLDTIRVWNDYQDTGEKSLTVGSLVKRKNREWRIHIPREEGTRNRIRSQWSFIKLGFIPEKAAEKLVLHDLILDYTPAPASFPPR